MGPKNYFKNNQNGTWSVKDFRDVLEETQTFISCWNQEGNAKEIDVMLDSSLP